MKHILLLGCAVALAVAITLGVAMRLAVDDAATSSAPAQSLSEDINNPASKLPSAAFSEARSDKPSDATEHANAAATRQMSEPLAEPSPTREKPVSAAKIITNKFIGTWVLDRARSEGILPDMRQVMVVTQSGNVMSVKTRLSTDEKGEWTVSDTYTLTGQEADFSAHATGGGTSKGKRTAMLTNNGSGIEVAEQATMEAKGASMMVRTTRNWVVAADGRTLTIDMQVRGPGVTQRHRRVFIRK